jgi:hypothetical protein
MLSLTSRATQTLRHLRLLIAAAALPLVAEAQGFSVPINLQVGIPQGEFAENVNLAGGFGLGGIYALNGWLGIRGQFDLQIYGSERRRVPLGGGALGLINVDVTTTNAIVGGALGLQLGVPGESVRPYVGGMIGFSSFTTASQVSGTNSEAEPFASSTNAVDNTLARIVYGGLYIPFGAGGSSFDIGVRHTWNGESVRYLTPGDITEAINGDIILSPNNTRADLLTVTVGVTLRPGGARNTK